MRNVMLILVLFLFSCKKNYKQKYQEETISLSPNISRIKENYYRYPLNKNLFPNYSIYSPIEPSKSNKEYGKTLIKSSNNHNYYYFFDFIKNNMNGEYSSYIFENKKLIYKNYIKIYSSVDFREKKLDEIEKEFDSLKIGYKFLRKKDNGYTFLLVKNNQKDSAFCFIQYNDNIYQVNLYYNVKDTINSLTTQSMKPFIGKKLEN